MSQSLCEWLATAGSQIWGPTDLLRLFAMDSSPVPVLYCVQGMRHLAVLAVMRPQALRSGAHLLLGVCSSAACVQLCSLPG